MVNKSINVNVKTKGVDEATEEFKDLGKATEVANDSLEGLNKTFEEANGDIQPLTTRMGEAEDRLYELALAGDTASKEYQGLLAKVGEYRKVQIQTDLAVDAAATTLSQKLGGALTGATSGFAAVQGVMGLVGSESETLEKTLLKVQSALALQQGVQGVLDYSKSIGLASKATKVFNLIVKANPLAIFLTIITAVVVSVLTFTDVIDQAIQVLKNFTDFIGITNFEENKLDSERAKRTENEVERIKEERKQRESAFNQRQSQFDREIAMLEAEGKSSFKLRQQKIEDSIALQKEKIKEINLQLQARKLITDSLGDIPLANVMREKTKAIQEDLLALNESILDSENQLAINIINNQKKKNQAAGENKKNQEAEIERLKKLDELERDRLSNLEKLRNELLDEIAEVEDENFERTQTEQENEERAVEEKYFRLIELAKQNGLDTNELEIGRLNELNDIKLKFGLEAQEQQDALDAEAAAKQKAIDDKKKSDAKALADYRFQVANQSLTAISDIAELFSKGNEKQAKRAFQVQKAVGIAQATINTAQAITKVFAETTDFTPTQTLRVANAVAIGVAGAAQVAAIASQQFQGGGGGGGTDVSVNSAPQAPSFNVVGDSGVNQLAQLQQQPTQAFVVSGEVTTAQALDRNRVQNATL